MARHSDPEVEARILRAARDLWHQGGEAALSMMLSFWRSIERLEAGCASSLAFQLPASILLAAEGEDP